MPPELVSKLSGAMLQAQNRPEVVQKMAVGGAFPLALGPDELKAYMAAEATKWIRLAREANIQPE
jgi:tripartite-type tricarboxylate transporter receptor subunit TctC